MSTIPDGIPYTGYLTDKQIRRCLDNGLLIEKGTWEGTQLRHASYMLRLGSRVELSRASDSVGSSSREMRLVTLTSSQPHLHLNPGDTALLYSMEILRFPADLLGFTVARGLLFAEALCPENTYVDPGFTGSIYTTVTNVSNRVVQVSYGMPLARLFFYRLAEEVQDAYRAGSALGITQQLTSVRAVAFGSPDELRAAKDEELRKSIRLIPIGGVHASELMHRLHCRALAAHQRIVALAIIWPALLVFANSSTWVSDQIGVFLGNVAASLAAGAIIWITPRVIGWVRAATD